MLEYSKRFEWSPQLGRFGLMCVCSRSICMHICKSFAIQSHIFITLLLIVHLIRSIPSPISFLLQLDGIWHFPVMVFERYQQERKEQLKLITPFPAWEMATEAQPEPISGRVCKITTLTSPSILRLTALITFSIMIDIWSHQPNTYKISNFRSFILVT